MRSMSRFRPLFAHTPIRILQNTLSDIAFTFEKPYEQNDCLIAQNVRLVATSLLILVTPLAWKSTATLHATLHVNDPGSGPHTSRV